MATLNAIVIKGLLTMECAALVVHTENGSFPKRIVSDFCAFISVSKSCDFTMERCERNAKMGKFCSIFI